MARAHTAKQMVCRFYEATRKASSCFNQLDTRFQLAPVWSTNSNLLISND